MADFNQDPYNLGSDPLSGGGTYGEGKISDALQRLRGLQSALQSGQIDYSTYNKLFSQFDPQALQTVGGITAGGSKAASAGNAAGAGTFSQLSQEGGSDLNTFAKQFQNLTGQAPTTQQINDYFTNVAPQLAGTNVADQNSLINNFLSTQYQPQINQYQQQQQTNQLNTAQQTAQNLIQQQNQADITNLTDPTNMAKIEQSFNQNGLLNSGVFSQGLADQLSQASNSNVANAIGGITIPGIQNIENTQNAPYQQFLNGLQPGLQQAGGNQQAGIDFQLESQLSQLLGGGGGMGGGSAALSGAASGAAAGSSLGPYGALAGAGLGAAGGYENRNNKSAICLELIRRGIATQEEVDQLHWKVLGSMFTRCRALIFYSRTGDKLVKAANQLGFDWQSAKAWFIDEPLSTENASSAIEAYAAACKRLAASVAPWLWDEREIKSNVLDFFKFIIPVMKVPGYRRCYKDLFKRTMTEVCYG